MRDFVRGFIQFALCHLYNNSNNNNIIPYYKYEPQSILENSQLKGYNVWSTITDRTIHNNRPDVLMLVKTIKEACLIARCTSSSSQQPHRSQDHHREAPEIYAKEELVNYGN